MNNFIEKIIDFKLKLLAKATIWRYEPKIIGVTGSVGKTSTKKAIEKIISYSKTVRSSGDMRDRFRSLSLAIISNEKEGDSFVFWSKILFKSFLNLIIKDKKYPEVLVLEYGAEKPGNVRRLLDLVRPTISIITSLGDVPSHIESFSGVDAVIREKSRIISQLPSTGFAILNQDEREVLDMKEQTRAHVVTYGFDKESDIRISSFENLFNKDQTGVTFKVNYGGSFIPVRLENCLGKSKAYSSAAAAAVGLVFGINLVSISEALEEFQSPPGRLKVIEGIKKSLIIDDTFNSSPKSMEEALEVFKKIKKVKNRKIAVIGGTLDIGKKTLNIHEYFGKKLSKISDVLITVGMRGKIISESAIKNKMDKKHVHHFTNLKDIAETLQKEIKKGDLILVKGSEFIRMENIIKEVMAEPNMAKKLLSRQNKYWLNKKGMYE
ncbi:MAG: Mur ligase family protein [Candidatus Paceibacterota bacterium]